MSSGDHLFLWSPSSVSSEPSNSQDDLLGFEGTLELDFECSRVVDTSSLEFDWGKVAEAGIQTNYLVHTGASATQILTGCIDAVEEVRRSLGGAVAIFKIGISSNLVFRWLSYKDLNYTTMHVLYSSSHLGAIEMLEAALIAKFRHINGCRNERPGGEGGLHARGKGPPYHCYVVGSRADGKQRVG